MNNYSIESCNQLIEKYINFGGEVFTIQEGILGIGHIILHNAKGKKTVIIKEYYINAWTSGHDVKMFNKLPKKYAKLIN